jgi:hypothetical protein
MQVIHGSHPRNWSDRYFDERAFGGEIFRPGSSPAAWVSRPAWLERFERGPEARAYVVEPNRQMVIQESVELVPPWAMEPIAPAFELREPPPRCRACEVVIDSWEAYEAHKEHVQNG